MAFLEGCSLDLEASTGMSHAGSGQRWNQQEADDEGSDTGADHGGEEDLGNVRAEGVA